MMHMRDIFLTKKKANKEKEEEKKRADAEHIQLESKYTVYRLAHALQYLVYESVPQVERDFVTYEGPKVSRKLNWKPEKHLTYQNLSTLLDLKNVSSLSLYNIGY